MIARQKELRRRRHREARLQKIWKKYDSQIGDIIATRRHISDDDVAQMINQALSECRRYSGGIQRLDVQRKLFPDQVAA